MKRECIINHLYQLISNIVNRTLNNQQSFGRKLTLTGDPYVSGKFALALSLLLERSPEFIDEWKKVWLVLVDATCDNWGKYYFLQALIKLKKLGILERVLTAEQLTKLRTKLTWQEMVSEETWGLKENFPTNFYGVAFSVSRLRFLLGWESIQASQEILQRLIEHYRVHSENGCSDETNGNGRFDRYSVLLVAEICQRHVETGLVVADWLKASLRQAVTLVLSMLNADGSGFLWGRSIGAYGDSAFNEILAVSAKLGVLNVREQMMANAYSLTCSERFLNFWYDTNEQSVNLWFQGRQTDIYRGEHRLVGENISLCIQHLFVQQTWDALPEVEGVGTCPPQLAVAFTAFRKERYIRGIYHWYDGQRSFVLPLINGDKPYHCSSPYFPIPFSAGLITGLAQGNVPLWVPGIHDEFGRVLRPLVWFSNCQHYKTDSGWEIIIESEALDIVIEAGEAVLEPQRDPGYRCRTRYLIAAGSVTREDNFICPKGRRLRVELLAAVYDDTMPVVLQGYTYVGRKMTSLSSPTGPLAQEIIGRRDFSDQELITVSWQLCYK